MTYESVVIYKMDIVSAVLKEMGASPILENKDFTIDSNFHHEHYVKFNLSKNYAVSLSLVFTSDALQINVDRANETFEWSQKYIEENRGEVADLIRMIFTSTIKTDYCGSNYTKLYFFDASGKCLKTLKFVTGLYLRIGCKKREYSPIY